MKTRTLLPLMTALCLLMLASHSIAMSKFPTRMSSKEVCNNLLDDDHNGKVDCAEKACQSHRYCQRPHSTLVFFDPSGALVTPPIVRGQAIPDYSHAGYGGGGVAIPQFDSVSYIKTQSGSSSQAIQTAISALEARPINEAGWRGAIVLEAGVHRIHQPLIVKHSGIVLRGSGVNQTFIVHEGHQREPSVYFQGNRESGDRRITVTQDLTMGTHAMYIDKKDIQHLQPGDVIFIKAKRTRDWLAHMLLQKEWANQLQHLRVQWERTVIALDTETGMVTVDTPFPENIDLSSPLYDDVHISEVIEDGRLNHVGVEHLTLISSYDDSLRDPHGSGQPIDEQHADQGILMQCVRDAWVRDVRLFYYVRNSIIVACEESYHVTIEDVGVLDMVATDTPRHHQGGVKYGINLSGSETLVQRSYVRNSRHAFIMNGAVEGNVFLDSYSESGHLASEPHQRWTVNALYDNVFSDSMLQLNRVDHSPHGQRAGRSMLYNSTSHSYRTSEASVKLVNAPNNMGDNYAIGVDVGDGELTTRLRDQKNGKASDYSTATNDSFQHPVTPRSLYLAQLWARKGNEALLATTTEAQRTGEAPPWHALRAEYAHIPEYVLWKQSVARLLASLNASPTQSGEDTDKEDFEG